MKLLRKNEGQGTLEYILIAAAIIGLALALIRRIEQPATEKIGQIGTALSQGPNNGN